MPDAQNTIIKIVLKSIIKIIATDSKIVLYASTAFSIISKLSQFAVTVTLWVYINFITTL